MSLSENVCSDPIVIAPMAHDSFKGTNSNYTHSDLKSGERRFESVDGVAPSFA